MLSAPGVCKVIEGVGEGFIPLRSAPDMFMLGKGPLREQRNANFSKFKAVGLEYVY